MGLMAVSPDDWNQVAQHIIQNDTEMLEHLACIGNSSIILNDILYKTTNKSENIWQQKVKRKQLLKLFQAIVKKYARDISVMFNLSLDFNKLFIFR